MKGVIKGQHRVPSYYNRLFYSYACPTHIHIYIAAHDFFDGNIETSNCYIVFICDFRQTDTRYFRLSPDIRYSSFTALKIVYSSISPAMQFYRFLLQFDIQFLSLNRNENRCTIKFSKSSVVNCSEIK